MLKLLSDLSVDENDLTSFTLDEIVRFGAKKLLVHALDQEVQQYIDDSQSWIDKNGHREVVRNGKSKERKITTGAGTIRIETPRVNDKRPGIKYTSKILPPYWIGTIKLSLLPAN